MQEFASVTRSFLLMREERRNAAARGKANSSMDDDAEYSTDLSSSATSTLSSNSGQGKRPPSPLDGPLDELERACLALQNSRHARRGGVALLESAALPHHDAVPAS